MLKNVKKLVSLFLVLTLSFAVSFPTFAADKTDGTKIKLGSLYVTTKYDPNSIDIDRNETKTETQVIIKDKSTGKILDVWGEEKAKIPDDTIGPQMIGTFDQRVYHDKVDGPVRARLYAMLEMYEYDSFVQMIEYNKVRNFEKA